MAITVNNKKIRSLPEQVAENSRKIKELETPQELYQYNVYIELQSSADKVCFDVYTHSGEVTSITSITQLLEFLDDVEFKTAAASGYCGTNSTLFFQVFYDSEDNEITITESDGNSYLVDDNDIDDLSVVIRKIK